MYGKYVSAKKELLPGEHFALLHFDTHSEAGYDRNDPSTIGPCLKIEIFKSRQEWEQEIARRTQDAFTNKYGRDNDFSPVILRVGEVKTKVTVDVGVGGL